MLAVARESGGPIGLVLLHLEGVRAREAEVRLGYMIAESAWGEGLASELVEGFVEWCRRAGVASIAGGVDRGNGASRRVLVKNGFVVNSETAGQDTEELVLQLLPQPPPG